MNNDDTQNVERDDYYNNNESYYSNNDYSNYSESTHEDKKNGNGTWWKILLIILILLIIILLLLKFCVGGNGSKSKDTKFEELRVRICNAATKYIASNPSILDTGSVGKSAIIKFKTLSDANLIEAQVANPYYDGSLFKKGTVEKYYSSNTSVRLTMQGDGTPFCEIVDNSQDITAPELRLNGDSEIVLAVGTAFEDPGYIATDDYDGDITDRVVRSGNVDISKAGTYTLTYAVQDSAGNTTSKTRVVKYEEFGDIDITLGTILDGVTPMIQLKGSNPYCMVKGTQYIEPGATATDNVDGNITDRISVTNKVSGNLMGAFRIVYKVEDSSGNQAIAYRAVIVTTECPSEETPSNNEEWTYVNNAPTITLIGKSAVTINRGTEYIDLGAQAYDKEDGDLTSKIITDATGVNTNVAGVYKVIYRVTDSGGKTTNKTRTVTVKEPVDGNPSVRFVEDKNNVTVEVGKGTDALIKAPKAVNENGVAVNVSTAIEDYNTKKAVSAIDWNKVGKYRVTYTAIHGNGIIKQTKTQIVTIVNGDVTIGGKNPIEVPLRSDNCNLNEADLIKGGVTFTGSSTPIVSLKNNEEIACKVGQYVVPVTATTEGGKPVTKDITVNVVDKGGETQPVGAPGKTIITGNSANPSNVHNTNGVWVGGAVTGIHVDFQATPAAGTQLAYFEYSKNCDTADGQAPLTSTTSNQGSMLWTEEGKNKVCIRAVSKDGIAGPWSDVVNLYIDLTGPTASFTHKWADGKTDWHNTPTLTVTYKATDSGSGLDHFEYTFDDVKAKKAENITTYNEATGKLVVSENTEATRPNLYVYVRAVDKVGNKGEWTLKPAYANIDTVKPEKPVIDSVDGNNTKVVKVNVSGFDTTSVRPSGIGKFVYTLNNDESTEKAQKATQTGVGRDGTACAASSASGNVTEVEDTCWLKGKYTGVLPIPANITGSDQKYDVRVWSVDRAGNKSDAYAMTEVTVKTGKKATGVTMKNGSTVIPNGGSCATDVLPGTTFKLTAEPVPTDADEKTVIWNMAVITTGSTPASVDSNGNVKALNVGTVDIIATIGSASTSCRLTVTNSITCAAGTYLPKGGTKCTQCPAGSYCPGGTYPIDDTKDQGKNPCAAGTYSAAGVAKCTACVQGSYSAAGATSCTACQSGKTTSAAGQTSCNANCSNAANAGTWKTAKWNTNNTMTDLCALNTCSGNYSVVGNTCVAYYNATYTLTSGTCTSTSDCSNALKASNVTTKVSSDKKVVTLTIPTTGNWNIEFYSSGKLKLDRSGLVVDLHAVGGGGGGAGANTEYRTGGGGGGYTKTLRNQTLGTIEYTVTIGAGGAGGASKANGGTGGTTSFATLISAAGGQGGKAGNPDAEQLGNGGNGGSGGGGSGIGWQSKCAAAGAGGSNGGNGGNVANNNLKNYGSGQGTTTRDFGESSGTLRAGGGGGRNGSDYTTCSSGAGGAGGGGTGGTYVKSSNNLVAKPTNGTNHYGGGGGGGANSAGGNGGTGIVIMRNKR